MASVPAGLRAFHVAVDEGGSRPGSLKTGEKMSRGFAVAVAFVAALGCALSASVDAQVATRASGNPAGTSVTTQVPGTWLEQEQTVVWTNYKYDW